MTKSDIVISNEEPRQPTLGESLEAFMAITRKYGKRKDFAQTIYFYTYGKGWNSSLEVLKSLVDSEVFTIVVCERAKIRKPDSEG